MASSPDTLGTPTTQHTHTLACRHGDFRDWHRGRPRYAVWAVAADTPPLAAEVARLQAALAPWLLPGYSRQPHVSVALAGFPRHTAAAWDEFDPVLLERQLAALQAAAVPPFNLALRPCRAFASAPYLAVEDGTGALARLRRALLLTQERPEAEPYVPHLTLGLFGGRHALAEMEARLARLGPAAPLVLPVGRLTLFTYASAVVGGPLEAALHFDLASATAVPAGSGPAALFA